MRRPGARPNIATAHLSASDVPPVVDLRAAYAEALGVAAGPARPGHRLVWIRGGTRESTELPAEERAFAIAGRHTQCPIVFHDDPFVALRHLLLRSILLPSGGVALRVVDLQTDLGFTLPDGSRHASVFVEGPVAIAVGTYALVALPSAPPGERLPHELPRPEVHTPPDIRSELAALGNPYRANARPLRSSRITLMPRPVMVGEPMSPSLGRLASGGMNTITISRGVRSATVTLADEDLVRGVMIGRSEKCHSEVLRRITDVNTSRAHVLVLRELGPAAGAVGAKVCAYDLASTQGTFVEGLPAKRVVLDPRGTTLTLGRGVDAVRLVWRGASRG